MNAGTVVANRFEIERVAGRGGMGVVYRAKDLITGEPAALKVIAGDAGDERFAREAQILAELEAAVVANTLREGVGGMLDTEGDALVRLTLAEALLAADRAAEAMAAIDAAEKRLLERAQLIEDAARRASFHEVVEENRRTLELARSLRARS